MVERTLKTSELLLIMGDTLICLMAAACVGLFFRSEGLPSIFTYIISAGLGWSFINMLAESTNAKMEKKK